MGASAFEYRYRFVLHGLIYALGFTAPWNYALHLDPRGPNAHVWGLLAIGLSQLGAVSIGVAFNALLVVAILFAGAGAGLRTWGAAYLGSAVVQSATMHTASGQSSPGVIEDGPYRFVRNPLYLGTILHTLALVMLMPRSGALFTLFAIGVLQMRLILAEEAFLGARLGAPYAAYRELVPRLLPALRPQIAGHMLLPRWAPAAIAEIYMWVVALGFLVLGWSYSAVLLIQCVLVAAGLSLVTRALTSSGSRDIQQQ